jgi:hypothetical protein
MEQVGDDGRVMGGEKEKGRRRKEEGEGSR